MQLEKIERIEVDEEDNSALRLKFVCSSRSGNYPVICEDVAKAYGARSRVKQDTQLWVSCFFV